MSIQITSKSFAAGKEIPKKFTGEGDDISPQLAWSMAPVGTKELALICDDPDAPTSEPFVHWVLFKIPANVTELPEHVLRDKVLENPTGASQGVNSFGAAEIGYRGPMPPKGHGVHHYHFHLYALDTQLATPAGADKKTVLAAMQGHILGEGELIGTYERR